MKEVIKHTISIWTKNSIQLIILSIAAMILPVYLRSYLNFNYVPFDYILQSVFIGGIYCYINDFQLTGKKDWKAYLQIGNLFLSFVLLAVTYILLQKLLNRVTNYISPNEFIDFVNITLALSKSTLLVFKHFGLVLSAFIVFELFYFGINETISGFMNLAITGVILSIEITFYSALYYKDTEAQNIKEEEGILNDFGKTE